jgi:hypothetical protein
MRVFKKLAQKVSASEGPMPRPMISRRPSVLGATAIYRRHPDDASATLAIAIAPVEPVGAALMSAGADQAIHVGLHQDLQHALGNGAEEITVAGLLQQLSKWHSIVGHWGSPGKG